MKFEFLLDEEHDIVEVTPLSEHTENECEVFLESIKEKIYVGEKVEGTVDTEKDKIKYKVCDELGRDESDDEYSDWELTISTGVNKEI